ncbi:5202_t:CDS:1, partial [Paraglomus brasilianum]
MAEIEAIQPNQIEAARQIKAKQQKMKEYHDTELSPHNNYNNDRNIQESPLPPIKQLFSFSDDEQGAIIGPLLNLVEKELNKFLVNNEHIIPFNYNV